MTRKRTPAKRPVKRRAPAKSTAKKTPAKVPAETKAPAEEPATPPENLVTLVQPLAPNALKLVLSIIDNATMKGSEAQLVIGLKVELGRVAGVNSGQR